jgi:hypothetical protein
MGDWRYGSIFLISALDGSERLASYPQNPHWIGSWVGLRVRVDIGEKKYMTQPATES